MTRVVAAAVLMIGALGTGACVTTETTLTGAARPGRPTDCPIEFFEGEAPYLVETVAAVQVNCHTWIERRKCIEDLRKRACKLGADTVYGFSEAPSGAWTMIWATMAVRAGAPTPARPRAGRVPGGGQGGVQ